VFCSDCLYESYHSSEEITILTDGKPWKPSDGSNGIFIRNTDIKD
jgi:hypothetical protein